MIDQKGEQLGILSNDKALELATNAGVDLVEVSPNADPPVCRIMDFGKYQYELKKQQSDAKKKQKKTHVKMIKYRPGTEEADYQIKFKKLFEFIENGDKVKVVIWFRGREVQHRELGMEMLDRIELDTEEFAVVEQRAKMEDILVSGSRHSRFYQRRQKYRDTSPERHRSRSAPRTHQYPS